MLKMKKANLIMTALLALIMLAGCPGTTENNNGTGNAGGQGGGSSWGTLDNNTVTWNAQVTNLKAEPGNGSIRVSWTNPQSEAFYENGGIILQFTDTSVNTAALLDNGPELTTKTFNNLTNGIKYIISIRLWYVDEAANKIYATAAQSVEATPTADIDNTVYLPSLTNFNARWDSAKECVILTWTDVTDSHAEGYYFFATTTNTRPAAPSYNENSFENLEGHSNRVGDNTISQESTELWINDENTPFKLQANTTYYIWALTEGTGDEDEYLYSKWDEMPMATVTTGTSSSGNGGGIAEGE